jgi:hypothetical protein
MTDSLNQAEKAGDQHMLDSHSKSLVDQVNSALSNYSDKDWNYSRISLIIKPLSSLHGPYSLKIEVLDQTTRDGRNGLKMLTDEVKWGERHSSELGVLELVSLRINKALLEVTSNDYWNQKRPVVRVAKTQDVYNEDTTVTLWYQVTEVAGEEFDNR